MRTPAQQLRAVLDAYRKQARRLPVTGGDRRTQEEAIHQSAIAKGQAMMMHKKGPIVAKLRDLQRMFAQK